jgi:hypothetical protein
MVSSGRYLEVKIVSRHAAAVSSEALCYDDPMADVASPHAAKERFPARKPRMRKHIVAPATAEQILQGVGVTKKDAALVRKVLLQLGYIQEENPPEGKAASRSKKS